MSAVIEAVQQAHADMSSGKAVQPAPVNLRLPSSTACFLPMAALAERQGLAVVKMLADIPHNREAGLAVQRSVAVFVSRDTGECLAIIDGQILTRQRTAAASAVASRHLARPDSAVLGLVGAGKLADAHVEAISEILPIRQVLVWSRSEATVNGFMARSRDRFGKLELLALPSPRDVVINSDVVCTLTASTEPIVCGEWFRPGLHLNAVGAPPRADHREIDALGISRANVFVDSLATSFRESGDLLLAIAEGAIGREHVRAELGDVIVGKSRGRTGPDEITLFNSVGLAMQDLAAGHLMIERARLRGLGVDFDLA
jgi:ornithine cyclodeaminase/alanine dehydrogenase